MKTLALLGLAVLCAPCLADNIVINGGFEQPVIGGPWAQWPPGFTFGSWTVDNVGSGVAQVGSFGQPLAIEGAQFVELNMQVTGGIWQALPTQTGAAYALSFLMAGQLNQGPDTKQMQVDFGGVTVASPEWSRSATAGKWVRHVYTVTALSDSSVLHFLGIVPANQDGGPYVDDVRLVPCIDIPEGPSSTMICSGEDAAFSVLAAGDNSASGLLFRWQYQPRGAPEVWSDLSDGPLGGWLGNVVGSGTPNLTIQNAAAAAAGQVRCVVTNGCGTATSSVAALRINSADFNNDEDVGTDADIEAFFACIAGNCCAACDGADFNADGDTATDADIEAFFRVLAGGSC